MRIRAEQVRLLYQHLFFALSAVTVVSIFTCIMFWETDTRGALAGWLIANLLVVVVRGASGYRYFRCSDEADAGRWGAIFSFGALLSGILWGALPWLTMDASSLFNVFTIMLMTFAMVTGAVGSHSSYPVAYFCYALPAMGLLIARIAMEGESFLQGHGFLYPVILMLAFLLIDLGYSIMQWRMIRTSILQRYENRDLLQTLAEKRAEAEKANEGKSQFLAAASHDLRQPLHALELQLELLDVEKSEPGRQQAIANIRQSSRALAGLLNTLFDISRLDSGQIEVNRRQLMLSELMRELADEWQLQFSRKARALRVRVIDAIVESDPVLLKRILRNLVVNALNHTDGDVLLGARVRGEHIRIEVWDQGPGLSEDDMEKIFVEFCQLNNPERDRDKGVGLGLAIVHRLAELLDHQIELKSWYGKGSCFSLQLPRHSASDALRSTPEARHSNDVSGMFVLLVEDEVSIRESMIRLLRSWDCEVLAAASGRELMSEIGNHQYPPPDAMVVDFRLRGEETGVQVLQGVRKYFNAAIPALMITGEAGVDSGISIPQLVVLQKPVEPTTLNNALADFQVVRA